MRVSIAFVIVLAAAAASAPAAAQQTDQVCPAGQQLFVHIGPAVLACPGGCAVSAIGPAGPRAEFRAEPRITRIDPPFARSSGLREGDVIVAVDGQLITTREGGRRWAAMTPGEPVTLRVRRSDREHDIAVTPVRACAPVQPARAAAVVPFTTPPGVRVAEGALVPGRGESATPPSPAVRVPGAPPPVAVTPIPPPAPAAGAPPQAVRVRGVPPPRAQPVARGTLLPAPALRAPDGWLGFAIECDGCGQVVTAADGGWRWTFTTPPRIHRIEAGSPAARAGLRVGDRIIRINGLSITTPEGGAAFARVRPGDAVRLELERDAVGAPIREVLHAEPRPALQSAVLGELRRGVAYIREAEVAAVGRADLATVSRTPQPLRFSGALGAAHIEVRSPQRVIVTELPGGEELEIVVGDTTVRVRVARGGR